MSDNVQVDREEIARAWLAEQQAIEDAEDKKIYQELVAFAASSGRRIVAMVQALPDGSAALPVWGVRKVRG